jgi:hypothetical protein
MGKLIVISAKIPEEVYEELVLRVPEGERSNFIREAVVDKLQSTPRPNKVLKLEKRINALETSLSEIKAFLADLEALTYQQGEINPHVFCIDELDHRIMNYLIQREGATTSELAELLKVNRWLILNRLKKIRSRSKEQTGKPIVDYRAFKKAGKKGAWWIVKEFTETD